MTKRQVSITDIAREAGVSIAAVSRILNEDSQIKVSPETRERVYDIARKHGYRANPFAAALRTKRTGIIGALSPNFAGTFLGVLMMELQREAKTRNIELLIGTPEVEAGQVAGQINKWQSLLFDGLLLLGDVLEYQSTIRKLQVLRKPYLSVCAGTQIDAPYVNVDDRIGVGLAIDYLVGLGHRRIAFIGSPHWSQEKIRAGLFRLSTNAHGIPAEDAPIVLMDEVTYIPFASNFQNMWTDYPLRAAQELLKRNPRPTAIFCANDGFALAALKGIMQMGLRVPEDISIIGYNDELTSTLFFPELTTIRQPLGDIAHHALDLLLRQIEQTDEGTVLPDSPDNLLHSRVVLKPTLVERGTCVRPASAL